jgi:hypothetical protein
MSPHSYSTLLPDTNMRGQKGKICTRFVSFRGLQFRNSLRHALYVPSEADLIASLTKEKLLYMAWPGTGFRPIGLWFVGEPDENWGPGGEPEGLY